MVMKMFISCVTTKKLKEKLQLNEERRNTNTE